MEPTHAWHLHDPALRTPWLGCVLSQRKMCPGPVVVVYASPIRGLERSPWAREDIQRDQILGLISFIWGRSSRFRWGWGNSRPIVAGAASAATEQRRGTAPSRRWGRRTRCREGTIGTSP